MVLCISIIWGFRFFYIMEDITWNIDNNDKFKVSIKLRSGKEIKIEDSSGTGIKDLSIAELQEANKKLSETITLLNQMLK